MTVQYSMAPEAYIQPHGCLIVCDAGLNRILHASENVAFFFGGGAAVQNASPESLLGTRGVHALRNTLAKWSDPRRAGVVFGFEAESGLRFDLAAHFSAETVVIEIEPAAETSVPSSLELVRGMIARLQGAESVAALAKTVPRLVSAFLGFEQVYMLKASATGDFERIGETGRKDSTTNETLAQPAEANVLIRFLRDYAAVPVALAGDGVRPDLTHAHLRAASHADCAAAVAQGIGSSLTLSLVVNGAFWGQICAQNKAAKVMSLAELIAAEMFTDFLALKIATLPRENLTKR